MRKREEECGWENFDGRVCLNLFIFNNNIIFDVFVIICNVIVFLSAPSYTQVQSF